MKLAPNVKLLPKDKHTEAVIFAGDNAHSFAEHYMIAQAKKAGDPIPPVYLGRYQLSELDNLQIVDEGRYRAKVIRAGNLDDMQMLTIATKLAIAGVREARLLSENFELLEDWGEQLPRLKETWERGESLVMNGGKRKITLPISWGSEGFDAQQSYVIKGLIPAESLCSTYGASGSYKSFLAISWSCHVATGMAWGGRRVSKGAVIYIAGEGSMGVKRRVKAWEITHDKVVTDLCIINAPVFPASPDYVEQVIRTAGLVKSRTGENVRLIVIDTLARCFGGNDENDSRDMGAFIQGCDAIKQATGATVLVVHHSGKDETKGARGSSAFRAALDAEYRISRENSDVTALVAACTKMKDAEEPKESAYDLKSVEVFTDTDGEEIVSMVVIDVPRAPAELERIEEAGNKTENHAALWQCIRTRAAHKEPCTIALLRDDMKKLGYEMKHFRRWLYKLENDGVIVIDGDDVRPL
ncbi:TPA: AAA family ATPase [Escherichia coli]|uniref:helicase RepA family protein n=2 Tax=Escherichia coli TaxID=562 RepID=UPI000B7D4BEB|nr:helicase RepA family protein [Escherichia coli]SQU19965.1 putative prophage protein [Escherichia coli]HBI8404233.1 AAA family ATPase [Escherichia coli]HBV0521128.1 AAA family ATPase [Escherichia coli]HCO5917200.1 AAA family ATPase [Escherichia coli]HCO5951005.1 AAA family ATPase [Escherichia coli]